MHDLLPFLRVDRFMTADEPTRAIMTSQAEAKYQQMRAFVDGTESESDLETRLENVLDLHPSLNLTVTFPPERGTPPPARPRSALGRAQRHAASRQEPPSAPGAALGDASGAGRFPSSGSA